MVAELVLRTDGGMGLDEAIVAYLAACEVEGKSPRTVDAYAETLAMFRGICLRKALPQRVGEFGPAHVYAFLKVIADSGVSLGTRHRRFRETRAFFSWCTRMGGCTRSPFTGIPNVKVEQKVIQPLSEEDIHALLDLCDPADEFGCRNRAIILLFLDTGMRYAELHRLTLADVSWEERRIHIRFGKGRKQRVVPFGDGPATALRNYVDGFRGEAEGPLFLTISRWGEPRRPMNKYLLGTLFTRLGQRAGVHAKPTPLPAHLRDLGHREPCPGARRAVPARPLNVSDGASLLGNVRRGESGRCTCSVQSGSATPRWRGRYWLTSEFPRRCSRLGVREGCTGPKLHPGYESRLQEHRTSNLRFMSLTDLTP